jgi:hypothetical protein
MKTSFWGISFSILVGWFLGLASVLSVTVRARGNVQEATPLGAATRVDDVEKTASVSPPGPILELGEFTISAPALKSAARKPEHRSRN